MSQDRLTRHEISWLLAQEARGAAKALREGVSQLKHPFPDGDGRLPIVESSLDTLEDAIGMLSALQKGPGAPVRRGRIDIALLLCTIEPGARIEIAPGAGTEVLGEESELARMLHVLVSQASSAPSEAADPVSPTIRVRREDENVRISIDLGPDSSATAELERRWLHRMAVRYGGRVELEGGTQSLILPADTAMEEREVAELRRELEEAQQLGEAYARELVAAYAVSETAPPPPIAATDGDSTWLLGMLAALRPLALPLRDLADGLKHEVTLLSQNALTHANAQTLERRAAVAAELCSEVTRLVECDLNEEPGPIDPLAILEDALEAAEARRIRLQVEVGLEAPKGLHTEGRPTLLRKLFDALLRHALAATPRGKRVDIRLATADGKLVISVADGGPAVPAAVRTELLEQRVDPGPLGRPGGLSLLSVRALCAVLGASLELCETAGGRTEVRVSLDDKP